MNFYMKKNPLETLEDIRHRFLYETISFTDKNKYKVMKVEQDLEEDYWRFECRGVTNERN